jgi:hypothetical protein
VPFGAIRYRRGDRKFIEDFVDHKDWMRTPIFRKPAFIFREYTSLDPVDKPPPTVLQEWTMRHYRVWPSYSTVAFPNAVLPFKVTVSVGDFPLAYGLAKNARIAKRESCIVAIHQLYPKFVKHMSLMPRETKLLNPESVGDDVGVTCVRGAVR